MTAELLLTFAVAMVPIFAAAAINRVMLRGFERHGVSGGALEAARAPWLFASSVLLGAAGGAVFGLAVSPRLDHVFAGWAPTIGMAMVRYAVAGPIAEELGKGLLLIALFAVGRVRGPTSAILLGLAAGAGFAAVENFVYALVALAEDGPQGWWDSLRVRVGFGTFVHAGASATLGAYLGAAAVSKRWVLTLAAPLAGVFAASAVHGVWNALIMLTDMTQQPVWALGAMMWLVGVGVALTVTVLLDARRLRTKASDAREQVP